QVFEAQVARTADAVAVVFDGTTGDPRPPANDQGLRTADSGLGTNRLPTPNPQSPVAPQFSPQSSILGPQHLSYQALNEHANRLARYLRACGVGPDVLIGLCLERSCEMIIGILGILKAGGAYVPLDLSYPRERLAFMFADSQAPVLVTRTHLLDQLPASWALVVDLDSDGELIAQESHED